MSLFVLFSLRAFAQNSDQETIYRNLGTGVTNLAASVTNTTAGEIFGMYTTPRPIRIWATASGYLATTNGVSATSNVVIRIVTASGNLGTTNAFDTASLSNIKLTLPNLSSATNTVSDWFELRGARYWRIGAIENNTLGSVSNLQILVGYPK